MQAKSFAVGVRVEHPQSLINKSQYGVEHPENLTAASYKLTAKLPNGRGVYTFCMCPGGYVVNASSEVGKLAINGMSNHSRNTKNANSAIVVTVTTSDFKDKLFGGVEFQEELEKKAVEVGDGNIPIQTLKGFRENKVDERLGSVEPIFRGSYKLTNLNDILPDFISQSLKEAFDNFNKKIDGFADDDCILAAIETRTSSPVRIVRGDNFQSEIKGLYPAGEGAGYAGGIMSAAMDGMKVAERILFEYSF